MTLAGIRVKGAQRLIERAEQRVRPIDADVAQALVPAVQRALPQVPVHVSSVEPPVPSDLSTLPLAVVQQTTPTEADADGGLSAKECVVHYFRLQQTTNELDSRDVAAAADDLGHRVEPMMGRHRDLGAGVVVDRPRLTVSRAAVGVPTIQNPDAGALAWRFTQRLAAVARTPGWAIGHISGGGLETSHVRITPGAAKVLDQTPVEDGTTELQVEANVSVAQHETVGLTLAAVIGSVARDLDGIVVEDLGRLSKIEAHVRHGGTPQTPIFGVTLTARATCRLV